MTTDVSSYYTTQLTVASALSKQLTKPILNHILVSYFFINFSGSSCNNSPKKNARWGWAPLELTEPLPSCLFLIPERTKKKKERKK